ncbi:uncharacterized protein TNCV_1217221 [Trichonephila clavipes]|nr:uncharacterized protein TNCV_1217221 [Trichonephila clavipes]
MYASSSAVNPTILAHADNQRDVHPKGGGYHIGAQRDLIYMTPRLEAQVQDYVEVRNPQNAVQLLEVLSKFEERYSCKTMRGSRNSDNVERRGWNERRQSNVDDNRRN